MSRRRSRSRSPVAKKRRSRSRSPPSPPRNYGAGYQKRGVRNITCFRCNEKGHHMKDCTNTTLMEPATGFSTRKFKRLPEDELKKGNSERGGGSGEGAGGDDEATKQVEDRIKLLLVRIGDKARSLEQNLDMLAGALEIDLLEHQPFILDTLFSCVKGLPTKASIYGTLVGLLNAENKAFGLALVRRLEEELTQALAAHTYPSVKLLLRFGGCLCLAHVLQAPDFITLLLALLGVVESAGLRGTEADELVHAVMATLPWVACELGKEGAATADGVAAVMAGGKAFMAARTLPRSRPLCERVTAEHKKFVHEEDVLVTLMEGLEGCREAEWTITAINALHLKFSDTLGAATPHPFVVEALPTAPSTTTTTTTTTTTRFNLRVLNPQFGLDKGLSLIDRVVVTEYIHDTILLFDGIPETAASKLLSLPVPFESAHLVVEGIMGALFRLPQPASHAAYYGRVMVELFQLEPKRMAPLVGKAIHCLFLSLAHDTMDTAIVDRFAQWFAFHLSNFNWIWPWNNWSVVLKQPASSAQRRFVSQAMAASVRLGYRDAIIDKLPPQFHEFLPPAPTPNFPFAKDAETNDTNTNGDSDMADVGKGEEEERRLSRELQSLLADLPRPAAVQEWLSEHAPERGLSFLLPVLLWKGRHSFSHAFALLRRHKELLSKLCASESDKVAVLKMVGEFWKNSTQHQELLLLELVALRVVSPATALYWLFQQRHMLHGSWVWRVVTELTTRTLRSINKGIQQLEARVSALEQTGESTEMLTKKLSALEGQRKQMLWVVVQQYMRELTYHLQEDDKAATDKEEGGGGGTDEQSHCPAVVIAARFKEFVRTFGQSLGEHAQFLLDRCGEAAAKDGAAGGVADRALATCQGHIKALVL